MTSTASSTNQPALPREFGNRVRRAVLWLCLASLASCYSGAHNTSLSPPNIVLIFVDDMGWGDVDCNAEAPWATPAIDQLADEGVRFTDFYVAQPVCSASRAALLTGCYPNRLGLHGALGPNAKHGIADGELTLAELCRDAGYATAMNGKWHLGCLPPFFPTRHGFDEWSGIPYSNDMWPNHPESPKAWVDLPTYDGDQVVALNGDQSRFTTDFTERTVDFIERSVAAERPFFAYLAQPMPHVPLHVSAEREGGSSVGLYGDVIEEIDWSVGRVMSTLERLGVDEKTLVIFASDNGPWLSYGDHAGLTGGLREGKGTTFEGGVRVPCLMRWPGVIPEQSLCTEPAMTIDVLPTIARLLGQPLPDHTIDGLDIWPLIVGEPGAVSAHESLAFYYHTSALEALRAGRWKLHLAHGYRSMAGRALGSAGKPGSYDYSRRIEGALFDLESDPYETTDVSAAHPNVVERLLGLAEGWRVELGDSLTERTGRGLREAGRVTQEDG
ncbi:MAG: arylsulfatase A [Pseudohongiellaceae bacterium]|jgi:arylsulfatase A